MATNIRGKKYVYETDDVICGRCQRIVMPTVSLADHFQTCLVLKAAREMLANTVTPTTQMGQGSNNSSSGGSGGLKKSLATTAFPQSVTKERLAGVASKPTAAAAAYISGGGGKRPALEPGHSTVARRPTMPAEAATGGGKPTFRQPVMVKKPPSTVSWARNVNTMGAASANKTQPTDNVRRHPMALNSKIKKLTQREAVRQYRLKNGLCLYCGAGDHWANACQGRVDADEKLRMENYQQELIAEGNSTAPSKEEEERLMQEMAEQDEDHRRIIREEEREIASRFPDNPYRKKTYANVKAVPRKSVNEALMANNTSVVDETVSEEKEEKSTDNYLQGVDVDLLFATQIEDEEREELASDVMNAQYDEESEGDNISEPGEIMRQRVTEDDAKYNPHHVTVPGYDKEAEDDITDEQVEGDEEVTGDDNMNAEKPEGMEEEEEEEEQQQHTTENDLVDTDEEPETPDNPVTRSMKLHIIRTSCKTKMELRKNRKKKGEWEGKA